VLGGLVAGILWQGALVLQIRFQMGVASYNTLYSGFAAIPIFLVWLYVSWLIVLLGAQLASSHQYEQNLRQALRARHVDQEVREALAVGIAADVGRRFLEGAPPPTDVALAERLEVPQPTVEEVLEALVRAGVVTRAIVGRDLGYQPARDLDALRLADVRRAVRCNPAAAEIQQTLKTRLGPRLVRLLEALDQALLEPERDPTMRALAQLGEPIAAPPRVEAASEPVLDAKQPEVPA
jgi:membrane protein